MSYFLLSCLPIYRNIYRNIFIFLLDALKLSLLLCKINNEFSITAKKAGKLYLLTKCVLDGICSSTAILCLVKENNKKRTLAFYIFIEK